MSNNFHLWPCVVHVTIVCWDELLKVSEHMTELWWDHWHIVIVTLAFGDNVQLLRHDRMIENNECLMWKEVSGQPILRSYLTSAWREWRKTWYISVTTGSCWVEIWTRHLQNMSCTSYHCVNLLTVTSFSHNHISILWFHVPDSGRITVNTVYVVRHSAWFRKWRKQQLGWMCKGEWRSHMM